MIRITSRSDGFRRCGIAHPATATDHPDDRFSPIELARLEAEPMLEVECIDTGHPGDARARPRSIRLAMAAMAAGTTTAWTHGGKPALNPLRKQSGVTDITSTERDAL